MPLRSRRFLGASPPNKAVLALPVVCPPRAELYSADARRVRAFFDLNFNSLELSRTLEAEGRDTIHPPSSMRETPLDVGAIAIMLILHRYCMIAILSTPGSGSSPHVVGVDELCEWSERLLTTPLM